MEHYNSWKETLDSFAANGTIPKIFVSCETLFNEETGEYDKTMYHFKTNYAGRSCGGGGFTPDECSKNLLMSMLNASSDEELSFKLEVLGVEVIVKNDESRIDNQ